jgi:hypothetical protein
LVLGILGSRKTENESKNPRTKTFSQGKRFSSGKPKSMKDAAEYNNIIFF